MTISSAGIRLDDVRFRYAPDASWMAFDADIEAGTITAVMGPSGSGKSTLFALLAGFERPQDGRILISGRDVTGLSPADRPISFVFQDNNLFAHLSVERNVALGIDPRGRLDRAARDAVADALARVGLAGFGDRRPASLSGGERQRVALARVLVRQKPVLLLDEPFAALGPRLRREMLALVETLSREAQMTTLMITHQPADARAICDRVLFLDNGRTVANAPAASFFERRDIAGLVDYLGA